jgi:hypothetical protein
MIVSEKLYGLPCNHRWHTVEVTSSDPSIRFMERCCKCGAEMLHTHERGIPAPKAIPALPTDNFVFRQGPPPTPPPESDNGFRQPPSWLERLLTRLGTKPRRQVEGVSE